MQSGPGPQGLVPGLGEDSQEGSVASVEQARGEMRSERHCREKGQSTRPTLSAAVA